MKIYRPYENEKWFVVIVIIMALAGVILAGYLDNEAVMAGVVK